jgi:dimethylargininase
MPLIGITHVPPHTLELGERTYVSRTPIDMPLALRQHAAYCALLRELGADVRTLETNASHADAVFVEDTALVLDEVAIMMMPGAKSRRQEPHGIEREISKYRSIRRIELPATIDGGDIFVVGKRIFVGASQRSNAGGAQELAELVEPFGYSVRRVGLRDCLHLKSASCPLPDGSILANPEWLADVGEFGGLSVHQIAREEPFAADVATIGETVIMSETNPRTADIVRSLGFQVRATALSEFEKAEGGVTCLSILFHAEKA